MEDEDRSDSFTTSFAAAGAVISEQEQENSELQLQQELERFSNNFDLLDNAVMDLNVEQNTLDVYVSWLNWIHTGNGTEMHVDLCYDEFLPRTIKLLLNTRNVYTVERARMISRFLLELFRFALLRMRTLMTARELPSTLVDCLLTICNPCAPFYLTHLSYEEEEPEEKEKVSNKTHLTDTETNELSVGSTVFLLQEDEKVMQGEIIEISPTDTEVNVMLTVGGSRWVSKEPTSFYRSTNEDNNVKEEEEESKLEHPRFRSELSSGFLCDAKVVAEDSDDDDTKRWYQACVVSVNHKQEEEDLIHVHLLGFPVDKDIVVARTSRLLAPLNMYSYGRRGRMQVCSSLLEDDNVEASLLFGDFADNGKLYSNQSIRARRSKPSCSFYISNINSVFADLIQLIQRNVNVNLRLSVTCLSHLLAYMTEDVTVHMASAFPLLVLRAIEHLTTQQIRNSVTKALINRTASVCHRLLVKSRYNDDKAHVVERIRMEFCRKLLESEMIMKRVDGLQLLNDLIRIVRSHPQGVYLNSLGYYSMHAKSNVQANLFAAWCQSQHFLASFFSPPNRAHSELIKRSAALVTMLCEETSNFEDFDLIWQTACTSDDEEISSASFALLGECSHCFPLKVKAEFKNKLVSVERATARQIDLFRDLVQVSPDLADVAVNALWKEAMREDSECDLACAALEQALRQEHSGAEWESQVRVHALDRCCAMLHNPKSLRIFRSAVESFPVAGNRNKLVDWLCDEKQVLGELLDTFEDCTQHAQFRLDCVAFVLRNRSSKQLEFATIEVLWTHFTRGNMEYVLYNWLQKIARATYSKKQQDEVVLSPEAMQLLFTRIQQDDFTSAFAFRVFQATFLGVNLICGKIRHTDTDFTLVGDDNNEPLVGEETLWSAALGMKSSDVVAESAAHYISFLHLRVPAEMRWERLAAKFQQVLAVMQQSSDLARCCTLLQYLLIDNESEFAALVRAGFHNTELWERIKPHSTLGPYSAACWVNVNNNIKGSVGNGKPFRIRIRANDAVGKVRGLIFETFGVDVCANAEDIRLFAGGGEIHLKADAKSLIAVAPHAPNFVACKRMTPAASSPSRTQQQQPTFEQWLDPISLFLLDALATYEGDERPPRWVDKAVRLLDLLPTSRVMVDQVLQVQDAEFDHRNAFRTTYLLEILQDEMHRLKPTDLEALAKPYFPRLQDLLVSDKLDGKVKPLRIVVSLLYHLLSACSPTVIITTLEQQNSTSSWPQSQFAPFADETKSILLSQIDFTGLQDAIVCRVIPLALEAEKGNNDLTRNCFALWSLLLLLDTNALFDTCNNTRGLEQIIAKCDSNVSQGMISLCNLLSREQRIVLFNACLRALPSENEALLNLTEHLLQRNNSGDDVNMEAIKALLAKIQELPRKEQFPPSRVEPYYNDADLCLVGLLRLLTQTVSISKLEEDEIAQFDCIALCVLGGEECKCQTASSRNAAYQCLLQICNALPGAGDAWFSRWFHSAFDSSKFYVLETSPPDLDVKSPHGFCGIVNLGATCYMNSLFQQLWAIPALRHELRALEMEPNAEDDDVELVMLLQSFFQELSHSTHRTCTLEPFAAKFKDELGARLNVLEQQDAQEIFERVCDRLDDCMHRQHKPRLFRKALGVKIASKFVCLEDTTKPTREDQGSLEWCLKVQLVPGCSKLEEILDKFVAGEVLQRFTWEDSGPSLRTLKKQVIKTLGNTLVIHLARFHMNWDTQVCEKSNDRLEFPLELDMLPYCDVEDDATSSSNNKEDYKFRLVGVLVHDGARLNSGHYYSYCESRIAGSSTFGKWYCFNDATVDVFDLNADLEEAAFGGMSKANNNGNAATMRTHGAYMLFYERVTYQVELEEQVVAVPEAVARQNHDHFLACRLFDPALLQFLTARCMGNDRLSGSSTLVTVPPEAKKQRTDSEALLDIVSSRFLTNDAIAARCGGLPAGIYYCPLAESLTRSLQCSPVRSSAFVNSLQSNDYTLLLVDVGGYRIKVSFAMLLCVAFQTSGNAQALATLLSFPVVDHVLQNPQVDNSYWFALKLIMECCNDLENSNEDSIAFAQAAFSFHLLPIVFNAVLGVASPAHQYELLPPQGNVLQKRRIEIANRALPSSAPSSSLPVVSWDYAIAACVACAHGVLARSATNADEHEQRIDELASWLCLSDVRSWANLITHLDSDTAGVLDSFEGLFCVMINSGQVSAVELAAILAKVASTSSLDAILRIYDLINKLSVACASQQQIASVFFLGENNEHRGLFSLLVGNRSNRFTFFCIAAFVERVVEEAQFLEMLALGRLDQWAANVDEFLRNDALANTLEPHELNRMIHCLELVNGLSNMMGSGAMPPQDLAQSNRLVSATSDNTLFDDDDDEGDVGSSSMEGGSINSDAVSSMLEDDDEDEA